jgi:hypothetical protein
MFKLKMAIVSFLRSLLFWIPLTETEIAMARISKIYDRKEKLQNRMFSGKSTKETAKTEILELHELISETRLAMSDTEYVQFPFETGHRKELVAICDEMTTELNGLKELNDYFD